MVFVPAPDKTAPAFLRVTVGHCLCSSLCRVRSGGIFRCFSVVGAWGKAHSLALAVAVCGHIGTLHASASQCVKTVRWNDDRPYAARAPDGEIRGIDADIVREALRRLGCTASFVELPWARALLNLERGKLDVLPNALQTEDRMRFGHFSEPYISSRNVLFVAVHKEARFKLNTLADLIDTDFRLGVQAQATYGPEYDELIANDKFRKRLTFTRAQTNGWEMIKLGRIDGQLADEFTGLAELHELGFSRLIRKSAISLVQSPGRFAFSRQSTEPEFVNRFNQALTDMKADGSYRTLLARYLPCTVDVKALGCK